MFTSGTESWLVCLPRVDSPAVARLQLYTVLQLVSPSGIGSPPDHSIDGGELESGNLSEEHSLPGLTLERN